MGKEEVSEKVRALSAVLETESEEQPASHPKWAPGFHAQFPWVGLGALLLVPVCTAASVAILVTSDHRSQTSWPKNVAPNVLLNIMNGISTICFGVALANGIAISWWRKALRGSSIADLQRSWAYSTSLMDIVLSLKYFNFIALGCLAAKLTIIDSTLMQRATSTYTAMDNPKNISNLSAVASTTFPVTGTVDSSGMPGLMTGWMSSTLKMWSQMGGFYPSSWDGCEGLCMADIPGIGFAFECDEPSSSEINYGADIQHAISTHQATMPTPDIFAIRFGAAYFNESTLPAGISSSYLEMNVSYTQAQDAGQLNCPGTKYQQSCKLWPAVVKYPVTIQNSPDSIGSMGVSIGYQNPQQSSSSMSNENLASYNRELQQQEGFEVLRRLPILESHASGEDINSTLAGIQLGLMMYIKSQSTLSWVNSSDGGGGGGFVVQQMGHAANYMDSFPSLPSLCSYWYNDPLDSYTASTGLFSVPGLIGKINQIMFGLATDVSQDNTEPSYARSKSFNGTVYKETIHYSSHYPYMWGAIACTLTCVLLTLPVFWGFWELGRKVTLGPFEIAHAFRSPIVAEASNPTTDEMMREVGDHQIRYGPIVAGAGRGLFAVSEPQNVAEAPGLGQRASRRVSWRPS